MHSWIPTGDYDFAERSTWIFVSMMNKRESLQESPVTIRWYNLTGQIIHWVHVTWMVPAIVYHPSVSGPEIPVPPISVMKPAAFST